MTLIYNTNFTHNPNSYLTLAIIDAARELFGSDNVVLADNRSLAPLAASGKHDVLICIDGQRLHEGLLRRVRHSFDTVVAWLFEDPFMLDYNIQNMGLFDLVFTNDPACVAAYGGKGRYLPLAASERFHFRGIKPDAQLEYDIFFAGTMWPNRVRSLRQVVSAFPRARFKLVCPTNEYLPPLPADLARLAIQWPVSHESFIDFANASRVTLTMFRDYASHGDVGQASAPGPRLYELGLSGTAQVVECSGAMADSHFDAVGGVDVVRSTGQLIDSIARLLANPELRAERAAQAQRQVKAGQLYRHRLQSIRDATGANFDAGQKPVPVVPKARKLRVLMCTHSTIHRNEWGGVEVYQQTVSTMLARDVEIFFWLRRDGQCHLMDDNGTVLERFDMHDVGWLDNLTDAPEEVAFSNALGQYGFDLVHFQHLGHHAASLPIIAKAAGVGTVFSAHDFFLVCSRYNLLNHEQIFCDIANKSISACDVCLRISEHAPAGAQQTRRAFMVELIRSIDVFLFGTEYSRALTARIYPGLEKRRCEVLGIPAPEAARIEVPPARPESPGAPLVVAVLGNFLRSKGADTVMNLIEEANPELFRFHLLGNAEAQYAEVLNRWHKPNVVYHGRYTPGDLTSIAQADVALHLSIWPETYCISLSEVWQAGLIPIVSDVGAFRDRVEHGVNGFKVPIGDISAVLDCLELLRASPATRRSVRAGIGPHLWTDYPAYAASLLGLYRSVAPVRKLGDVGLGLDVGQVHLLAHGRWRDQAPPRHIFDPSRRSAIRLELPPQIQDWSHIQGSEVYVDAVCGRTAETIKADGFPAAAQLQVSGWTFVPGISVGGQVLLALVGEGCAPVIFFPAERDIRDDILANFPGAPRRSGFSGQVALRGKWCEGEYQVAIVTLFGDRAAFCLTALRVTVAGGQVTAASFVPPSNEAVIEAFYIVSRQTGEDPEIVLPRLPVTPQMWHFSQSPAARQAAGHARGFSALKYHVDQICEADDAAGGRQLPRAEFSIRGWAFPSGVGKAGRFYVGLVELGGGAQFFVPAVREVRGDLATYFSDAPLCGGFKIRIEAAAWPDGEFSCVLINAVGATAYGTVIGFKVSVRGGRIVAIVEGEPDAAAIDRIEAAVTGTSLPPPSADPPPELGPAPANPAGRSAAAAGERAAALTKKVDLVRGSRRRAVAR